jgi:hypothetical protein
MEDLSKRRFRRGREILRFAGAAAALVALFLLTILAGRAAWGMYGKFVEASERHGMAQVALGEAQQKEERIATAVAALESERGVEAEIRSRFGLARPGEGEIKIVRSAEDEAVTPRGQKNIFVRIWEALFVW